MSLQTITPDDLDAEIDRRAGLTAQVLTLVGASRDGRAALTCALAHMVAAEADHDDERADEMLRGEVFPEVAELVDAECLSPFDPADSGYLN